MSEQLYRCPRTGRALVPNATGFQTHDGAAKYRVTRNVPDFRLAPPPDPADEQELRDLATVSETEGWRPALARIRPHLIPYVDDPTRAMFLDLLPLDRTTRALEIGTGLGQILDALAPRVATVHGLELSPGQALFAAERCRQAGHDNVFMAAGGDDLLLPYASASFDVVILNHVIEWIHHPRNANPTSDAQQLLLSEIRRVLRPGGALFISTKNRYGLRLLLGGRDENARDLRFGNALPRPLAAALGALNTRRTGFRGLLHSYTAFERLLRSSGFETTRSFWAAPDSRYPQRYIPTDAESVRRARKSGELPQGTTRVTRLLMPLVPNGLVKFVAPGLTFIARAVPGAHAANTPRIAPARNLVRTA
jgi:SAM-dependent methyltransferase